jgi:FtsZ-binding cell division protein ZapB
MTNREKTLAEAPELPTDTCPYINFIQQILDEIKDENESFFIEKKLELIHDHLEYLREANESLRRSSHYWKRAWNLKGSKQKP